VPWAKKITIDEFIPMIQDITLINNTCSLLDIEVELEIRLAERLEKTEYLVRLSSDDEARRYVVSQLGVDRVFSIIETNNTKDLVVKIDEYDLFLMWLLYLQIINMENFEDVKVLADSIEYIFKGYNIDISKIRNGGKNDSNKSS